MSSFQIQMLIAQDTNQNVKTLDIVQDYNICIICGAHVEFISSYFVSKCIFSGSGKHNRTHN